ncbi:MAG: cytochrome C [Sulfurimonas sp.]|nr:cytochrome C [Sulfurimonas sp.]
MSNKYLILFLLFIQSLQASDTSSLLFNGNCITCHKETKSVSAPSVVEFKKIYFSAFSKKEDFVEYMSTWVQNPKEETSLMRDAIKKYSLMPHLCFDKETLIDISTYIYETDFTRRGGRYWSK